MENNPFRRHSTLLGFSAAVALVAALGWLTHWRELLIPLYVIAAIGGLWFFARAFYGFSAAERLYSSPTEKDSVGGGGIGGFGIDWDGRPINALNRAYENWRVGARTDFERLADEENRKNAD